MACKKCEEATGQSCGQMTSFQLFSAIFGAWALWTILIILIDLIRQARRFCNRKPTIYLRDVAVQVFKEDFDQGILSRGIDNCLVKSLTSEATPSATQFFKRSYKISNNPRL